MQTMFYQSKHTSAFKWSSHKKQPIKSTNANTEPTESGRCFNKPTSITAGHGAQKCTLRQERGCGYRTSRFIRVVFLLQLGTEPKGNGPARQITPHPGNSRESMDGNGRCTALSLGTERLGLSLKTSLPDSPMR